MRMMAFYGKGGIGKSTVVTNLAVLFARGGARVLQFGCDPKSDSCYSLVEGRVVTVMEQWQERGEADLRLGHCLMKSRHGVDCLEVGGPTPGTGCGGRGITKAFELVGQPEELARLYDLVLFDVLGDVVCGGFSAPLRAGYAREVYVVTSGEPRALYAANNISHAVVQYAPQGVRLGGFIGNLRGNPDERERLERLAALVGSRVVHVVPKDPAVTEAELRRVPVVEHAPEGEAGRALAELQRRIAALTEAQACVPRPLERGEFDRHFHARAERAPLRPGPG